MPEESSTARRFGRPLLITAGITIGLLALLYGLRTMIISRGADMIMARLAADGGPRITIGSISAIGLSGLRLQDINSVPPPDSAIKTLGIRQAAINYFLPSLLHGIDSFLATTTIDIDGVQLELDFDRVESDTSGRIPGILLPAVLPRVRVADGSLRIRTMGRTAVLDALSLSVDPPGNTGPMQLIGLAVGQASILDPEKQTTPVALSLDLLYSPSEIQIQSLLIDRRQFIETGYLDLAGIAQGRAGGRLSIRLGDGTLDLSGRMAENTATLTLSVSDLDLAEISALVPLPVRPMAGNLNAQAEIILDPAAPMELSGDLTLRFRDGRINDQAVPSLDLSMKVGGQQAEISTLHLLAGANTIDITGALLPLEPLVAGDIHSLLRQGRGAYSFQIDDPGGLLAALDSTPPPTVSLVDSSLSGLGELEKGEIRLAESTGKLGNNSFSLANLRIPVPLLLAGKWDELPSGSSGRFSLLFQDIPRLLALAKKRPESLPTVFPGHRLELSGTLDNNRLAITAGAFDSGSTAIRLKAAAIDLPGSGSTKNDGFIDASLAVKTDDIADITTLFDLPPVSGSLRGDISLNGPLQSPTGAIQARGSDLIWSGLQLGDLQLAAESGDGRLVIRQLELRHAADFLKATATIRLADSFFEAVDLHLSVEEAAGYIEAIQGEGIKVSGRLDASLKGSGSISKPEGALTVRLDHGSVNETRIIRAAASLTGSGTELHLTGGEIELADGRVEMSGRLRPHPENRGFTASLESLSLERNEAALRLSQPAEIGYEATGSVWAKNLLLTGPSGSIQINGSWPADTRGSLKIRITDLNSRGWLDLLAPGLNFSQGNAEIEILGSRREPLVKATGSASGITAGNESQTYTGNFDLSYSSHGFDIRGFTLLDAGSRESLKITGRLPLDPLADEPFLADELALKVRFELPYTAIVSLLPNAPITSGDLHGDLALRGSWERPLGGMTLAGRDIVFPILSDYGATVPLDMECDLRFSEDLLTVQSARMASSQIGIDLSGEWRSPPSLAALLRGQKPPTPAGSLDLSGRLAVPDVGWMAGAMVGVHRLAGALEYNTRITGPVDAPDFTGTLTLVDGELRSGYDIPTIRALELKAGIDKKSIRITSLQGELGGSPFSISGEVTDYLFDNPKLDLLFSGSNILLYRDAGLRLRADTSLSASGPLDQLTINGELNITDGRYTRPVNFFNFFRTSGGGTHTGSGMQGIAFIDPPLNKARLNIKIKSTTGVRVKNNLIDGTLRPDMAITGSGEAPLLTGRTYMESMRIKMPAGRINLTSGLIQMTETAPGQVFLDLSGQSRIMGYDISVQANGAAADPIITLSSSPPLPNDDLLLLLFTGTPPAEESGTGEGQVRGKQVALYLGRNILSGWFDSDTDSIDETILDRLELEIGRGITRLGEDTIEAQFRLTEKVFGEDDILFITAEKDIYDAFNSGIKIVFRFQ